ncbi:MAG: NAD-dependent epimerase/dehydratase family protein [Candidatus Dormiibacterota bacterium]
MLGGTVFLSAAIAAEAVARGHDVACLARAVSGSAPTGASLYRADREDGAEAYRRATGQWDAVVEVSWQPSHVRDALVALADRASHWTYVSSCSVYADQNTEEASEGAEVLTPLTVNDPVTEANYGEAKVACENACLAAVGPRLHVTRPGLIGGPGDPSDRFGYWPARFARRREDAVLVPADSERWTQTIDVRDLAAWIVTAAERGVTGTFNAAGESTSLSAVLELARRSAEHTGPLLTVDPGWLLEHGVHPWSGPESLPLWLPLGIGFDGFARRICAGALDAGLRRRPLSETVAASLDFERESGLDRARHAGLSPAKERSLLRDWSTNQPSRPIAGAPD